MKRILRWMILISLLATTLFIGVSWVFAQRLTRARQVAIGALPTDFPYATENVAFATCDGETLAGWFVPAPDCAKAIVLLHGYTGNRKQMVPRARHFRALGYNVLLYDARACGESSGDCTTFGFREKNDLLAAVQFLKDRGTEQIACLGVSQGGATILFAADEVTDVKCVICESVYDDMTNAVDRRMRRFTGLPGWLGASVMVPFAEQRLDLAISEVRPIAHIEKLKCPVFVISGTKDDRTYAEDTQRLFDAAREPKQLWMIEGARHEDLFHFDGYSNRVNAFLNRYVK